MSRQNRAAAIGIAGPLEQVSAKPKNPKASAKPRRQGVPEAENPEWTADDFKRAKRPEEALAADVLAAFPKTRGAQKAPRKIAVSIRLSPEVIEHFKKDGPGWQSRIDEALRKVIGV